jgi:hypothetical protein
MFMVLFVKNIDKITNPTHFKLANLSSSSLSNKL